MNQGLACRRNDADEVDVAAALAVLAYSAVLNRSLPPMVHLPANLLAAGTAVLGLRMQGTSWEELGMATGAAQLGKGARTGIAVAAPILACTGILAVAPATRWRFDDARVLGAQHPIFEVALRIPVGTALCEELIFRGALMTLFARHRSSARAAVLTSALFGVWHVLPTLDAHNMTARRASEHAAPVLPVVVRNVATTSAAGMLLAWMRRRSGSVLAPVIAHTAMNASAFLAARLVVARDRSHAARYESSGEGASPPRGRSHRQRRITHRGRRTDAQQ
jgi:membrane protease YdiL (CAAX protease family)